MVRSLDLITFKNWALPMYSYFQSTISVVSMKRINGKPTTGGYDPVQYNVPEGSYASDPNDPYARILELQDTIDTYHRANLSVIMDVVYNHVYQADEYAFEQIVPGYFYRYNAEGERTNGPSVEMT